MKILIGENYKSEFDSILGMLRTDRPCPAFEGRSISTGGTARNPSITYGEEDITFVYTPEIKTAQYESGEGDGGNFLGFTRAGATWFSRLRGEEAIVSADTRWEDFMGKISQLYHNRFSIVEYCQSPEMQHISEEHAKVLGKNAIKLLMDKDVELDERSFKDVSGNAATADTMDVYILYLRLSVGYGSAEPKTILGNVCLKRSNLAKELLPLLHEEADDVMGLFSSGGGTESQLTELKSSLASSSADALHERARELHKSACDALRNMVTTTQNENSRGKGHVKHNFMNYLNLDEYEMEIIRQLLSRTSHDNAMLECRKIELLSISHIRWDNSVFEYYEDDIPRLRFIFSLNDSITVKCINCGESIVNNNVFMLKSENGEPRAVNITAESLTDTEQELIRKQFAAEHLVMISGCSHGRSGEPCRRLRCPSAAADQCFAYGDRWYCKDCDKPEVVSYDENYAPFPTLAAEFSISEKKMIPEENSERCSVCGRHYTKTEGRRSGLCELCAKVKSFVTSPMATNDEAHALYKKYAQAVPLRYRINTKRRAAFEDAGIVLIVIGSSVFELDKLFSLTSRRIPSARPLKNKFTVI